MTDTKNYELEDLISTSLEQKPIDFADVFNNLLAPKLQTAIENKKAEIAQSMFKAPEVKQEEDTTEEE